MDILISFLLLGAFQGAVLSFVLFYIKKNKLANRIMAILLGSLSYYLVISYLIQKGIHRNFPHILALNWPVIFLFSPLLYLYVSLIISKINRLKKEDFLHFLPFAIHLLYMCFRFYFLSAGDKIQFLASEDNYIEIRLTLYLISIQGLAYSVFAAKSISKYSRDIKKYFSTLDKINLQWLHILLVIYVFLELLICFIVVASDLWFDLNGDIYIGMMTTILILVIGYFSLAQPEIFNQTKDLKLYIDDLKAEKDESESDTKYQRNRLSREKSDAFLEKLLNHMEKEKPHLDSSITLTELAEQLSMTTHQLSQIMNDRLSKNFFKFINSYRIEEVKAKLIAPRSVSEKIITIAYDSGFNSQASFSKSFKSDTGLTPSEYRTINS